MKYGEHHKMHDDHTHVIQDLVSLRYIERDFSFLVRFSGLRNLMLESVVTAYNLCDVGLHCPHLVRLTICASALTSLDGAQSLLDWSYLYIASSVLVDTSAIYNLCNLTELVITQSPLTVLCAPVSLECLTINNSLLKQLPYLPRLHKLVAKGSSLESLVDTHAMPAILHVSGSRSFKMPTNPEFYARLLQVSISYTSLPNIDWVQYTPALEVFRAKGMAHLDMRIIMGCTRLIHICVDRDNLLPELCEWIGVHGLL